MKIQLCNFIDTFNYDLRIHSLRECWENFKDPAYMGINKSSCASCELEDYCNICPAKNLILNNKLESNKIQEFCDVSAIRKSIGREGNLC